MVSRYAPDSEPRTLLDVLANLAHNAALLVIMAEVCLIYATAGWYKIQGSRWQDGTALYYPLKLDYFTPWPALSDLLASSGVMVMLLTYGTVIVQVAFPFTLFNRRVKNVLLVAMMLEHAAIAVLLGLPFFSLAMIAADAVFLPTVFLVLARRPGGARRGARRRPAGPARRTRPRRRHGSRDAAPYARRVTASTGVRLRRVRTAADPDPSGRTDAVRRRLGPEIGVGPHPLPWPQDERYDPELLAEGDRRNVVDRYRYWTREAIVADLDTRRHDFHVAVENWGHDFNIGSVVRTANAFLAKEIHIVGRRRWNRRGAMVTDRYQHVRHHPDTASLTAWAAAEGLPIIGIDNLPGRGAAGADRAAAAVRAALRAGGARADGGGARSTRRWCARSRSSARRARSTRGPRRRSRCTPGCSGTRRSRLPRGRRAARSGGSRRRPRRP